MKLFKKIIMILTLGTHIASATSLSPYVYTSDPDKYASKHTYDYFVNESDTHKVSNHHCRRRIDTRDHIQVVCAATIYVLIFGGHSSPKPMWCRFDFEFKEELNQFLTQKRPTCTE